MENNVLCLGFRGAWVYTLSTRAVHRSKHHSLYSVSCWYDHSRPTGIRRGFLSALWSRADQYRWSCMHNNMCFQLWWGSVWSSITCKVRTALTCHYLCIIILRFFNAFFLSCKANVKVQLAKTGHSPHSSQFSVNCVAVCVVNCVVLSIIYV